MRRLLAIPNGAEQKMLEKVPLKIEHAKPHTF